LPVFPTLVATLRGIAIGSPVIRTMLDENATSSDNAGREKRYKEVKASTT
jgi:hypothetical protein